MRVEQTGVGTSEQIRVNEEQLNFKLGIYVVFDGTFDGEYTVELNVDDDIWVPHSVLEKRYTAGSAVMFTPVQAVRLNVTQENTPGTVTLIVQQGA